MEAIKNNTGENTAAAGPDLGGLMSGSSGELIKYLLSTGGAVLINYLMSIKPMQDKMEALTTKVNEQERQIREMTDQQNELIKQLNKRFRKREEEPDELDAGKGEYFSIKKNKYLSSPKHRKYIDL